VEKPATTSVDDVLNDPWTDDEYTELFKAMIRWKPTGGSSVFTLPDFRTWRLVSRLLPSTVGILGRNLF